MKNWPRANSTTCRAAVNERALRMTMRLARSASVVDRAAGAAVDAGGSLANSKANAVPFRCSKSPKGIDDLGVELDDADDDDDADQSASFADGAERPDSDLDIDDADGDSGNSAAAADRPRNARFPRGTKRSALSSTPTCRADRSGDRRRAPVTARAGGRADVEEANIAGPISRHISA